MEFSWETAPEVTPMHRDCCSFHVTEFQDGKDQTDNQQDEDGNARDKKIDVHHSFLPSSAASLK